MIKFRIDEWGAAAKKTLRNQKLPALLLLAACLAIYFVTMLIKPGAMTFAISFASLCVVIVTALARVNDLNPHLTGVRWQFRRAGLVLAGAGSFAILTSRISPSTPPISWNETMLYVGFAMSWLTTPNMPPWWRWIAGKQQQAECETCVSKVAP